MDTPGILAGIEAAQTEIPRAEVTAQAHTKYIVFLAGGHLYALPADDVQEIMLGLDIHYLPFVPDFVRGLINRLGEPLTVLDLVSLLQGRHLDGKAFLILKPSISKMALLIDAVQDIARISVETLRTVSVNSQGQDAFACGVFRHKDEEVTVLSLREVVAAVRKAVDAES